jgi:hypothetical protein
MFDLNERWVTLYREPWYIVYDVRTFSLLGIALNSAPGACIALVK